MIHENLKYTPNWKLNYPKRRRPILLRGWLYRLVMRIAHRYHWHYAPPIYTDGNTQLWCKWCGFRQTIIRHEPRLIRPGDYGANQSKESEQ